MSRVQANTNTNSNTKKLTTTTTSRQQATAFHAPHRGGILLLSSPISVVPFGVLKSNNRRPTNCAQLHHNQRSDRAMQWQR